MHSFSNCAVGVHKKGMGGRGVRDEEVITIVNEDQTQVVASRIFLVDFAEGGG